MCTGTLLSTAPIVVRFSRSSHQLSGLKHETTVVKHKIIDWLVCHWRWAHDITGSLVWQWRAVYRVWSTIRQADCLYQSVLSKSWQCRQSSYTSVFKRLQKRLIACLIVCITGIWQIDFGPTDWETHGLNIDLSSSNNLQTSDALFCSWHFYSSECCTPQLCKSRSQQCTDIAWQEMLLPAMLACVCVSICMWECLLC